MEPSISAMMLTFFLADDVAAEVLFRLDATLQVMPDFPVRLLTLSKEFSGRVNLITCFQPRPYIGLRNAGNPT